MYLLHKVSVASRDRGAIRFSSRKPIQKTYKMKLNKRKLNNYKKKLNLLNS